MNNRIHLIQDAKGLWLLENGREIPVLNTQQAADRLRVSYRQIYRYLENRLLRSYGKVLGDWIIDEKSVEQLTKYRPKRQPIPKFLQYLFPEYDLQTLNAGRDRTVIIPRILEHGNLTDVQWVFKRYRRAELVNCLESHGGKLLTPKARRFWCLYLKVKETRNVENDSNPWGKLYEME